MGVSSCDRYEELVDEMRQSSRIRTLNSEHRVNLLRNRLMNVCLVILVVSFKDLFQYLEKHANQSIEDIFIAWDIADTVLIEVWMQFHPCLNNDHARDTLGSLQCHSVVGDTNDSSTTPSIGGFVLLSSLLFSRDQSFTWRSVRPTHPCFSHLLERV